MGGGVVAASAGRGRGSCGERGSGGGGEGCGQAKGGRCLGVTTWRPGVGTAAAARGGGGSSLGWGCGGGERGGEGGAERGSGGWGKRQGGGVRSPAAGRCAALGAATAKASAKAAQSDQKGAASNFTSVCFQLDCSATPSLCGPQQLREAMNEATRRNLGVLSLHIPLLGRPHPTWNATAPSSPSLLDCRRLQPPGTRSQRSCSLGALHALYERAWSPTAPCHGV